MQLEEVGAHTSPSKNSSWLSSSLRANITEGLTIPTHLCCTFPVYSKLVSLSSEFALAQFVWAFHISDPADTYLFHQHSAWLTASCVLNHFHHLALLLFFWLFLYLTSREMQFIGTLLILYWRDSYFFIPKGTRWPLGYRVTCSTGVCVYTVSTWLAGRNLKLNVSKPA